MGSPLPDLPVGAVLDELGRVLDARGSAVLVAPPGTGKTTLVPLALAAEPPLPRPPAPVVGPHDLHRSDAGTEQAHRGVQVRVRMGQLDELDHGAAAQRHLGPRDRRLAGVVEMVLAQVVEQVGGPPCRHPGHDELREAVQVQTDGVGPRRVQAVALHRLHRPAVLLDDPDEVPVDVDP